MCEDTRFTFIDGGTVTSARGFKAAGAHAGFRKDPGRLDLALVEADEPFPAAGVFTQNSFCAAPVLFDRAQFGGVGYGTARAVVVNSGIANAATGPEGLSRAERSAELAACAIGCAAEDVLVASTGVIGVQLSLDPFEEALPGMHAQAAATPEAGHAAARAIMTTDTHPKECAVAYESADPSLAGARFTVGGMVKGSGMIMPNMATMIAVLTTDAPLTGPALHAALTYVADRTFNKITVDSDTSTNDSAFLLASGAAACGKHEAFAVGTPAFEEFRSALLAVCTCLARMQAADGEGATRLVTVRVTGAATDADADACARTIANSPLVKTAVFGHDANWGRIAAAAGRSGASFDPGAVSIDLAGLPMMRQGLPVPFDEDEALARFEAPEIEIAVDLGAGDAATTVWTCDFSHDYVTINGDYRS
jgi:glutamate N-acetyltransferase/amino-acid N-acetyltransferase